MRSKCFSQPLKWLGVLLLVVPLLLIGWFFPDLHLLFAESTDSTKRQKPMSAEGKFLWVAFVILLLVGLAGWGIWRYLKAN